MFKTQITKFETYKREYDSSIRGIDFEDRHEEEPYVHSAQELVDVYTSEEQHLRTLNYTPEYKEYLVSEEEREAKIKEPRLTIEDRERLNKELSRHEFKSQRNYYLKAFEKAEAVFSSLYLDEDDFVILSMLHRLDLEKRNKEEGKGWSKEYINIASINKTKTEARKETIGVKSPNRVDGTTRIIPVVLNDFIGEDTTLISEHGVEYLEHEAEFIEQESENEKIEYSEADIESVFETKVEAERYASGKKKGQLKFNGRTEQTRKGKRTFTKKYKEFLETYSRTVRKTNVNHPHYDRIKVEVMQPAYKPYNLDYMSMAKLGEFTSRQIEARETFKKRVIVGGLNNEDDKITVKIKSQIHSYIGVMANDITMQAQFLEDFEKRGIDRALAVLNAKVSPINKK